MLMLWMGDHWSWIMSMQMVPSAYTFGWKMSQVKRTLGGFSGYWSLKTTRSENAPPAAQRSSQGCCHLTTGRPSAPLCPPSPCSPSQHRRPHLPKQCHPAQKSWRTTQTDYPRTSGSRCIPAEAGRRREDERGGGVRGSSAQHSSMSQTAGERTSSGCQAACASAVHQYPTARL